MKEKRQTHIHTDRETEYSLPLRIFPSQMPKTALDISYLNNDSDMTSNAQVTKGSKTAKKLKDKKNLCTKRKTKQRKQRMGEKVGKHSMIKGVI